MTTLTNNPDIYAGTANADTIFGLDGGDIINGLAGGDTIYGGDGNDFLTVGAGADTLWGGGGIDTASYIAEDTGVQADLESGKAFAGGSKDTLHGIENVTGTQYSDSIEGNLLANTLSGGFGADSLWGRGGNDKLYGGDGTDSLVGGDGADLLDGGAGRDSTDYTLSGEGVIVNLKTGTGLGGEAQSDVLVSIEDVTGSTHDDILTGNSFANTLAGNGGNDTISGGRGDDEMMGGGGNDTISGGQGDDMIHATSGTDSYSGGFGYDSDTLSYMMSDGAVEIDLQSNEASGGFAGHHTISGIESLWGSQYSDVLLGNGFANTLRGMVGDDRLDGRAGADTLYGEHGDDQIDGGEGNDTISGGAGRDLMTGGGGADRFVFGAVLDSGATSATRDVVAGFEQGIDKIDLSAFDGRPGTGTPGHQPLGFLGSDAFSAVTGQAELRYRHANGSTIVEIDTDYDGAANSTIRLDGVFALTVDDFML